MKVLHVFPTFGDDLTAGSEHYQHMLTQGLAALGADVEVLATCSRRAQPTSALSSRWVSDYRPGAARVGDVTVRRFPVTISAPALMGYVISHAMSRRWRKEDRRASVMADDPASVAQAYHLRASARPRVYDIIVTLARGPHSLGLVSAMTQAIRRADIVVAGFVPFATLWYATVFAKRGRKPLVLLPFFHPDDRFHHFRVFYDCFARADAVLSQTAYSAALFKKLIPMSNPVQVGVGVDPRAFAAPSISGERFRARHGLTGTKIVLFVGRKEHPKRYDIAVEAVDRLADDRVKLVMVGADVDGRPLTSSRAVYLGLLDRAELLDAYDACDVFVLPSEHESFGIVLLEAWMSRKPVIGSSTCAPVASIIEHGRDGYLCRDVADFAARIGFLLDHPKEARAFGTAGRTKTMKHYTWDAIGARVYDLCAQLVAQRAVQVAPI